MASPPPRLHEPVGPAEPSETARSCAWSTPARPVHVCTDAVLPRAELGLPPTLSALLFVSPVRTGLPHQAVGAARTERDFHAPRAALAAEIERPRLLRVPREGALGALLGTCEWLRSVRARRRPLRSPCVERARRSPRHGRRRVLLSEGARGARARVAHASRTRSMCCGITCSNPYRVRTGYCLQMGDQPYEKC